MKILQVISFVFIVFSVQLFALDTANIRVKDNNNHFIAQYANEVVNIQIVDSSQYTNKQDSIEELMQNKEEQIRLLNEQQELMQEKVHKQKMYFLISAIVISLVVLAIFIGLMVIVRKSQKN